MVLDRVNAGNRGIGNASAGNVGLHSKRIQAGLSTQIVIQVEEAGQKFVIGAIQSLEVSESRSLAEIKEVGTDAIIGIVPSSPVTYSVSVQRMLFDFQRLPQALQREYRHVHAQRRPFDIVITDYNPYIGGDGSPVGGDTNSNYGGGGASIDPSTGAVTRDATAVETTLKNCWFKSLSFSYSADAFTITERADLSCEHIYDNIVAQTLAETGDALERQTNISPNASIMSAFDGVRQD
jgi:hypothetical protein